MVPASMTIIDPRTGTSLDHPKLLSLLMEWTSEAPILNAMMKARRGSPAGLAMLANLVKATAEGNVPDWPVMDERATAACIVSFLIDSSVRNTIARYVALAHQVPYKRAKMDLYDLRVNLVHEYQLRPNLIPDFNAQQEEGQKILMADGTAIDLSPKPLPEWAERYQQSDQDVDETAAEWLRSLPPDHQEIVRKFPPGCLVRATFPCHLPAPGEVAIVAGLVGMSDGTVCLGVASSPEPEAITGECKPEWLEAVGFCGRITPERIAEVLDGKAVTVA